MLLSRSLRTSIEASCKSTFRLIYLTNFASRFSVKVSRFCLEIVFVLQLEKQQLLVTTPLKLWTGRDDHRAA
jgi:hypothetical protein